MSFSVSSESIIFQGEVIDSPVLASFEMVYRALGRHARSPVTFPPRSRLRSCHKAMTWCGFSISCCRGHFPSIELVVL